MTIPGFQKICTGIMLLVFLLILPVIGHSQEMLGIVTSNYSGIAGSVINPANTGTVSPQFSVNVLSGDVFISSNYFFVHKKDYRFLNIFSVDISNPKYMYIYDYPEFDFKDTVQYYDYKKNSSPKNLYFNGRVMGPSLLVRNGNHAFSLITGFRNNASVEKIPYDVANFGFRGQDFEPQQNIVYDHGMFRFAALSWVEIGLGYTYTFFKDASKEFNAGIVVKGLLGTGCTYGVIDNVTYMVPNHDSIYFYRMNGTLCIDLPMDLSTNTFSLFSPLVRGWGLGFDFGLTFTGQGEPVLGNPANGATNTEDEESYLYRIGLSLLDAGKIRFTKNVQVHEYSDVTNVLWSGLSSFHPKSIQEFLRSASFHLLGDSLASLTEKSSVSIILPTAVSIQGDYNFGRNFFLNATFIQGVRLGQPSVRRPSLIALTPRYETKIFGAELPVSLYDFRDPAIGLALRIYSLIIGTEKLGTFFNLTDVSGIDLYFSLTLNITSQKKGGKFKTLKGVKCDSYQDYKRYQIRH